jgi:hypothetical protein
LCKQDFVPSCAKALDPHGFVDPASFPEANIDPCPVPDGCVNLDDILAVLDAFAGFPPCADPCPAR